MYLIADAGSTKTQWCLVANNGKSEDFFTDGLNPFFQTTNAMVDSISNQLMPQIGRLLWIGPITHIFFYGAGCTPEKKIFVEEALRICFRKTEYICIESDMLGAARALLGHEKGIACIMGTGSNSCLYDGKEIIMSVPALGFILGDEGSGAVLGKRLVADILKNQLGEELCGKFLSRFNTNRAEIIDHVYRKPFPNRYLASLSVFAAENIADERIYNLVYDHFNQFVVRNLKQYPQGMPVGFVGSIAYFYKDVLTKVLEDNGMIIGQILKSPVEGLKKYHRVEMSVVE